MSGTNSNSASLSTAPFTDAEKADIRRFCGFPPYGSGAGGNEGWRYFQQYGELEYRMNNMAPAELQVARMQLANCYQLEADIPAVRSNSDTSKAAVWERNPMELAERRANFRAVRLWLCQAVGMTPGPMFEPCGGWVVI